MQINALSGIHGSRFCPLRMRGVIKQARLAIQSPSAQIYDQRRETDDAKIGDKVAVRSWGDPIEWRRGRRVNATAGQPGGVSSTTETRYLYMRRAWRWAANRSAEFPAMQSPSAPDAQPAALISLPGIYDPQGENSPYSSPAASSSRSRWAIANAGRATPPPPPHPRRIKNISTSSRRHQPAGTGSNAPSTM